MGELHLVLVMPGWEEALKRPYTFWRAPALCWPLVVVASLACGTSVYADAPAGTRPPHYHWEPAPGGVDGTIGGFVPDGFTWKPGPHNKPLLVRIPDGGFPSARLEFVEGHIFVPVTLNGKVTRWLGLDTGSATIILSSSAIREAALKGAGIPVVHSKFQLDAVPGFPLSEGFIPTVQIYGTNQSQPHAAFIGPMDSFLSSFGEAPAGILGLSGMPGAELLIDFKAQTVSFFPQPAAPDKLRALGLSVGHSLAFTEVQTPDLDIQVGGKQPAQSANTSDQRPGTNAVTIFVDGKPQTLALDTGAVQSILDVSSVSAEQKRARLDYPTLYGNLRLYPISEGSIDVAGWKLGHQTIRGLVPKPGSATFPQVMGLDLLSQFQRVLIDFVRGRVYFGQPIAQMAKSPAPK